MKDGGSSKNKQKSGGKEEFPFDTPEDFGIEPPAGGSPENNAEPSEEPEVAPEEEV